MFFYFFAGYIDASLQKKPAYAGILAARLFKCPTEINQMNRMPFALFCDRADRKAIATIAVPIHVLVTNVEEEVLRVVVVVVRSRTPIVAVVTVVVER